MENIPKTPEGTERSMVTSKEDNHLTFSSRVRSERLIDHSNLLTFQRKELLDGLKQKQPFRVAIGKNTWQPYETFDEAYNLREILDDEIVIEFDSTDQERVLRAIGQTGVNLRRGGIIFEMWDHGGKSPHLHIRDLPIKHLTPSERAIFKKVFIRTYVDKEDLPMVDFSLTGIHLIAIEWAEHWKGCYGVKKLIATYDEKEVV